MNPSLPEPRPAAEVYPAGQWQPVPSAAVERIVQPYAVLQPIQAPQLPSTPEGMRVVGYARHGELLEPIYGPHYEPVPTLPPPPPVLDPIAQRMAAAGLGGGVLSAGAGWGLSQVVNAAAALGSGGLMWIALMVIAAKLPDIRAAGGGNTTTINKTVHNHNKWWGKSSTRS